MNHQLDKLIADIDAVINGEAPGAVGSGDLAPEVKEKVRALLAPFVVDCRLCERNSWACLDGTFVCVNGDKFKPGEFTPMWRVK